ncbi:MAG: AAA family ATPase [Polyangiales bacterium]
MTHDVVTSIRAEGIRSIDRASLGLQIARDDGDAPAHGVTVLIGENGSGKSTLIEVCQLLQRLASPDAMTTIQSVHGGVARMLRPDHLSLRLGVTIEGVGPRLDYDVAFSDAACIEERLVERGDRDVVLLERTGNSARYFDAERGADQSMFFLSQGRLVMNAVPDSKVLLSEFGVRPPNAGIARMRAALSAIEVHVGFEVLPMWVARATQRKSEARGSVPLAAADRLSLLGANLPNAYHALQNDFGLEHWARTLDLVRLGLGDEIETVSTAVDPAGGAVALRVKLSGSDRWLLASQLSDGMLAYLAVVAMLRLNAGRTLLAIDEPELHLHPGLLVRVIRAIRAASFEAPVLVATHARRFLDELDAPEQTAVLCARRAGDGATRLLRADPDALARWLAHYDGLGRMLDEGVESLVMCREEA